MQYSKLYLVVSGYFSTERVKIIFPDEIWWINEKRNSYHKKRNNYSDQKRFFQTKLVLFLPERKKVYTNLADTQRAAQP